MINGYDNKVHQADVFIRKIINRLEEKGYLDDAVVVITSDHGEALGEHGQFGHGDKLHNSMIRIPLLFYFPGEQVEIRSVPFGALQDIAPTVLGRLGFPIPRVWEGQDLYRDRRLWSHHISPRNTGQQAVIADIDDSLYKLIFNRLDGRMELYNISEDPDELHNKYESAAGELLQQLYEIYRMEFDD